MGNLNGVKIQRNEDQVDSTKETKAYHHGSLREALVSAAEHLLAEKGVDGFTLRECARRAGVSPAAPAHHFGDVAGLLTTVATRGFDALGAALEAGNARGGDDPVERLRQQGIGYVSFALQSPGSFKLIFRKDRLNCTDAQLGAAARSAFLKLETAVRDLKNSPPGALNPKTFASVIAAWSLVHGFAHLAVDGEFERFLPGAGPDVLLMQLLPGVLDFLPDGTEKS